MDKTGLVLKVERNTAILLSNTGEFVKVNYSKNPPKVGETYTGTIKKESNYIKYLATAIALFLIIICSGGAYAYSMPIATVQVNINPSIELKINRFDRIIEVSPKNTDGEKLLKNLHLGNKNIDEALILVVNEARKDNFINSRSIAEGKTISVKILAKDPTENIKIDKFEEYINHIKVNTNINVNGKESNEDFMNNSKKIEKKDSEDKNIKNKTDVDESNKSNGKPENKGVGKDEPKKNKIKKGR